MTFPDTPLLSVVMPVYNEAELIEGVVSDWIHVLGRLGIDYELRVYDDGSRDATSEILARVATREPRLLPLRHDNRGHGPTLMRAYAEARGEWVFQTDSDGEIAADDFERVWSARDDRDVIVGIRAGRKSPLHRRLLTLGSRLVVASLFGRSVTDVNSPFRLMRGEWLRRQLPLLHPESAVPNILLSGLASRTGARVSEISVAHVGRRAGASTLDIRRIAAFSMRAVVDAVRVAVRVRFT